MQSFLNIGDSTRAFNTLRKLTRHEISRCVLVGGLAVEFHCRCFGHSQWVIQSLELTLGKDAKFIRAFDAFRKKRNVSSYGIGGGISHREVEEMIGIARTLQQDEDLFGLYTYIMAERGGFEPPLGCLVPKTV